MSTTVETTLADRVRDDLLVGWHPEATSHADGFIVHDGGNVVAVDVGSFRPRQVWDGSGYNARGASEAIKIQFDYLDDDDMDRERSQIEADLVAAGWPAKRLGDLIVVDGAP